VAVVSQKPDLISSPNEYRDMVVQNKCWIVSLLSKQQFSLTFQRLLIKLSLIKITHLFKNQVKILIKFPHEFIWRHQILIHNLEASLKRPFLVAPHFKESCWSSSRRNATFTTSPFHLVDLSPIRDLRKEINIEGYRTKDMSHYSMILPSNVIWDGYIWFLRKKLTNHLSSQRRKPLGPVNLCRPDFVFLSKLFRSSRDSSVLG